MVAFRHSVLSIIILDIGMLRDNRYFPEMSFAAENTMRALAWGSNPYANGRITAGCFPRPKLLSVKIRPNNSLSQAKGIATKKHDAGFGVGVKSLLFRQKTSPTTGLVFHSF